jgi:hypothetical protein
VLAIILSRSNQWFPIDTVSDSLFIHLSLHLSLSLSFFVTCPNDERLHLLLPVCHEYRRATEQDVTLLRVRTVATIDVGESHFRHWHTLSWDSNVKSYNVSWKAKGFNCHSFYNAVRSFWGKLWWVDKTMFYETRPRCGFNRWYIAILKISDLQWTWFCI